MNIANKTILITGSNRGIGRALVEEALRRHVQRVYAGTRASWKHADSRLSTIALDVTSAIQIQQAVTEIESLDWVFDGGHIASRFISIKPKLANSTTDVHIVSDHGNEYTLELQEVSTDPDPHFDSKVFITPGDQAAKEKLTELPVFVPASELDQAKQQIAAARAAEAATLKAEQTKEEEYRSQYPGTLQFDFTWDESKGKELGLKQIWRDDKFTYLRGQFQETPALYEVKDGKPSLINFDFSNGL